MATLGIGVGLTLTSLTLWKLINQLRERVTSLTLLRTEVTVLMSGALLTVLLAVADFASKVGVLKIASLCCHK